MTVNYTSPNRTPSPSKDHVGNPFHVLLAQAPHNDARALYSTHRSARSTAQRALLLDPTVPLKTDPELSAILQHDPPDFALDTRHNLTVWARPNKAVYALVLSVQQKLREAVGVHDEGIWFPPPEALHMSVFEISSGLSASALRPIVDRLAPHAASLTSPYLASPPSAVKSPPVLDTPTLNTDLSGIALSFLPASSPSQGTTLSPSILDLRAALWDTAARAGIVAAPRYVFPTAHITVGRFVSSKTGTGPNIDRSVWVKLLDEINTELAEWKDEWPVEKMVLRAGVSWYGGGMDVGKGSEYDSRHTA